MDFGSLDGIWSLEIPEKVRLFSELRLCYPSSNYSLVFASNICLEYMSSELLYSLGWIFRRKGWVVFGQQKFIIRNVICLVAVVIVRKFDIYIESSYYTSLIGLPKKNNPKILVPDQFSVKFMSRKADEIRSQR